MQDDFPPVPPNATGPPPDYGAAGEDKNKREPPGGYLGDKKKPGGGRGGPGPVVVEPIEPDPPEPNYSVGLPLQSIPKRIYERLSSDG
jgi:hypothetical protein